METTQNTLPLPTTDELSAFPLRVSDLRQWLYCPRKVWWTYVCPVQKTMTLKMRVGMLKEHRLQRLQKRRSWRSFGFREQKGTMDCNVPVHSASLQLSGRIDLLLKWGHSLFPVEIKYTKGPVHLGSRLQLAGYALLLEETTGFPITQGYVVHLPEDTVERIPIDGPLRQLTLKTIAAMRNMIARERIPPPNPILAKCADCECRLFCRDVQDGVTIK